MDDFNNFHENIKTYCSEEYVLIDGKTGSTKYVGTSLNSGNVNVSTWRLKKEWIVDNIQYMGFPNGDQSYEYSWSGRTGYTYK